MIGGRGGMKVVERGGEREEKVVRVVMVQRVLVG